MSISLDNLFANYNGTSVPEEIDWGDPEGEEIFWESNGNGEENERKRV